ncbi:anthranilate phosphoribosyltransferase [Rhabdochromatium marinum]|uniref:anthranilate phosphoribosyltransferase n=1 Tax=Rhabdochromatium marinum TaxID=48729 RepID=UPI001908FF9A|nr:anthranilate phosphoribosyltransferase [Rhabdochromatium marinum]MBK1649417.1 anthranilate phosphoribosyltransferase [Rhabdochromatium marinum]
MDIKQAIARVIQGQDLDADQMTSVMRAIMMGAATSAQVAGILVALRMKGETVEEIAAAATVMRELAVAVDISGLEHVVDIVGTGGDHAGLFNISTASMFVAAAAGCHVAKHGNRSVSSRSGSADVLETAGVRLDLTPDQVGRCVRELGVGFLFAPGHHMAMKHAIGPRRELGVRTVFNLLGPLTNPAGVPNLVLGVYSPVWVRPMAEVLQRLGAHHALVVHSHDGLDEISIGAPTRVAELSGDGVRDYEIRPEDVGLTTAPLDGLRVVDSEGSLELLQAVFDNHSGPARDIVAFNAGAAIYVAGRAANLAAGVEQALNCLASGAAKARLADLVERTQSY